MVWWDKGTNIIQMMLEHGYFPWPGCNRRNEAAGRLGGVWEGLSTVAGELGNCWGHRRKCTEHFSACLPQGFSTYLFLSLSSPPLMAVIRGQGSLPVLAICGIHSAELVGFPPRPTRGLLGPLQPTVLAEPKDSKATPLSTSV